MTTFAIVMTLIAAINGFFWWRYWDYSRRLRVRMKRTEQKAFRYLVGQVAIGAATLFIAEKRAQGASKTLDEANRLYEEIFAKERAGQ